MGAKRTLIPKGRSTQHTDLVEISTAIFFFFFFLPILLSGIFFYIYVHITNTQTRKHTHTRLQNTTLISSLAITRLTRPTLNMKNILLLLLLLLSLLLTQQNQPTANKPHPTQLITRPHIPTHLTSRSDIRAILLMRETERFPVRALSTAVITFYAFGQW